GARAPRGDARRGGGDPGPGGVARCAPGRSAARASRRRPLRRAARAPRRAARRGRALWPAGAARGSARAAAARASPQPPARPVEAMSDDIVALVHEAFAALDEGRVDGLVPCALPDCEGVAPPEISAEPDTSHGQDGIRRYFTLWAEDIDDLKFEPKELIEADDALVVVLRITGRGRGSGAP